MKYNKTLIMLMIFAVIACVSTAGSVSAANAGNNTICCNKTTNTTSAMVTASAIDTASDADVMNETGQSEYTGPQTNTSKWNNSSFSGATMLTALNGTIYVSSSGSLYAISPSGTILWNNSEAGGTPVTIGRDGTIYVHSGGNLIAVNPNGTIKWTYITGDSGSSSGATIGSDGVVYFADDNTVYAIDTTLSNPTREDPKWAFRDGSNIRGGVALSADGKTLYFETYGSHTLYALNTADGNINWNYTIGTDYYSGGTTSAPVVGPDGTIYVGAYGSGILYAFNPNGTVKWNTTLQTINGASPVISSNGTIYIGSAASRNTLFYALNSSNGKIKWQYSITGAVQSTAVIGSDGTVYIGTRKGMFYAFNPDLTVKWTYDIKSVLTGQTAYCGAPALGADGTLYFAGVASSYGSITGSDLFAFQDLIANFTPTQGNNPLNYIFKDTSSNIPTNWSWNFGDGNTSTEQNPLHQYANPGKYTVTLKVTTEYGDTNTTSQEITVLKDTAAPVVTAPTSRTYNDSNITLTADDDFDQDPLLYYSLDNGATWHNATKSVMLSLADGTSTIQYYTEDASGNKGTTQTLTYTIDTVAPTASIDVNSGIYNTDKTITLNISENGTIYYTLDGSTPTASSTRYTGPITISSTKTLKYIAVDGAGNTSPVYTAKYTIDRTAPKISSTIPKNSATYVTRTGTITIKFSEKIKANINWSKVYIKNLKTGKKIKASKLIKNNTLYIKTGKRSAYTCYQVYIPASAVKDSAGNRLAKGYTWKFKTGRK